MKPMKRIPCEVLVVGAGPAGSSAALAAVRGGADVIMIDRRPSPGSPLQCAEYIPKMLASEIPIPPSVIVQEVRGMRTHLPGGEMVETRAPGYMIDRTSFDRMLALRAVEAGVSLMTGTRALMVRWRKERGRDRWGGGDREGWGGGDREGWEGGDLIPKGGPGGTADCSAPTGRDGHGDAGHGGGRKPWNPSPESDPGKPDLRAMVVPVRDRATGERILLEPLITIGADGPCSVVGRSMGSVNTIFVQGIQYRLPLAAPMTTTDVYFRPGIHGGYGWVFPKGNVANVGIGIRIRRGDRGVPGLKAVLDRFVSDLARDGILEDTIPGSVTAGLIPVGGGLHTRLDTCLLAGDAAGQTDPITGAGIPQAVVCGTLAGTCAAQAIREGDPGVLDGYEPAWRRIYGAPLDRAVLKRRVMESARGRLDSIIRECWPSFPGYYRDDRVSHPRHRSNLSPDHRSNRPPDHRSNLSHAHLSSLSPDHRSSQPPGHHSRTWDRELDQLRTAPLIPLLRSARKLALGRHGRNLTFYHPGMINREGEYGRYQAISITGDRCGLGCDHCRSKLLEPMIHATTPETLLRTCRKLDTRGDLGVLLSGGCDRRGRLPWGRFLSAIREVKDSTGLLVSVHAGMVDRDTARGLKEAGVDQALMDVIANDATIGQVYHGDYGVADIRRSLDLLSRAGLPLVPHIIVGLGEWPLFDELEAIAMIEDLEPPPQAVVVVSFMPLPGTPMARTPPPHALDIARILAVARLRMPDTRLLLGCARDRGDTRIERAALLCGINGIVLPSDAAVRDAKAYEYETTWVQTCCSVPPPGGSRPGKGPVHGAIPRGPEGGPPDD